MFGADTPQGRVVLDWCAAQGVKPRSQIEVRAGQVACALVACGAGIAVVDELTARAWHSHALHFRPLQRSPQFDIFAVHHGHRPRSALAHALVEEVTCLLKQTSGKVSAQAGKPSIRSRA